MGEDFFKYLPSEIIVNILSRLPTRAAVARKCVCKEWLSLLATPKFVNSRSVPGIVVETNPKSYEIIEFMNELDHNFDEKRLWNVAFNFELPFDEPMHSSANGLIILSGVDHGDLILCNPITRGYIKLPCSRQTSPRVPIGVETFGFGVSRMTSQYKIVRIFGELILPVEYRNECQVYVVGTGSWRKVPFNISLGLYEDVGGVYLNGNIHWAVGKITKPFGRWILCFDLET
ncbi:putative F-box protein At3g24700 [Salvia splendens]|uniref:putative F-box protein At3g24700 n=1 Tax=Salvia splendens TaxID=180675 RepID=UPI001C271A03|nr:putative F-box protein At3g24700 [Salvia splendens]